MSCRIARGLVPVLAAVSLSVHAEDPADELVVTATRSSQPLRQSIQDLSVITEREIRASQAVDLPTLLRKEAGVEFTQNGGLGRVGGVYVRGASPNQTLVLIDGVRVSSATTGTTQIEQIMLDQVERIEILRGSGSSLYGSDAMGGVIQIFTKQGRGAPAPSVLVGLGNEGTTRLQAGYGGEIGDTRFNVNLSGLRTDAFSVLRETASPTADPDRDRYTNTSASANVTHYFDERFKAGASYYQTSGRSQFDNAFAARRDDKQTGAAEISALAAFADGQLTHWWQSRLAYARGTDQFDNYLNNTPAGVFKTVNDTYTWQNNFTVAPGQLVILGAEALHQEVSGSVQYDRSTREVNSVFGSYRGTFGPGSVQVNLRNDHYSDFGSKATGLAGAGYQLDEAWRATASVSRAFRAPSFNELYFPFFGNPNLQPEQVDTVEGGVQWAQGANVVRAVAFYSKYKDLIAGFPVVNVGEATIKGAELSWTGRIGATDIKASVTFQDPVNDLTGERLIRRATHFGSLQVAHAWGPFRLGAEMVASGNRYDNDVFTFDRVILPGYAVFNLTASYALTKTMSLGLRADNLFDRDYTLVSGYNVQGRLVLATFSYTPAR